MNHSSYVVVRSEPFDRWLRGLRDRQARARILVRIDRLAAGNPGYIKPVGDGVSEMRIDHGPGYRVYLMQKGAVLAVLLAGGDKSTHAADIASKSNRPGVGVSDHGRTLPPLRWG